MTITSLGATTTILIIFLEFLHVYLLVQLLQMFEFRGLELELVSSKVV
jgi:hypothetical protein